jgi:hypothetical protein
VRSSVLLATNGPVCWHSLTNTSLYDELYPIIANKRVLSINQQFAGNAGMLVANSSEYFWAPTAHGAGAKIKPGNHSDVRFPKVCQPLAACHWQRATGSVPLASVIWVAFSNHTTKSRSVAGVAQATQGGRGGAGDQPVRGGAARARVVAGARAACGAAAVASFLAAVLTEIYLCGVCSCQEILRRNGRGQSGADKVQAMDAWTGAAVSSGVEAGGLDIEELGAHDSVFLVLTITTTPAAAAAAAAAAV